jgi:hypothetical protein
VTGYLEQILADPSRRPPPVEVLLQWKSFYMLSGAGAWSVADEREPQAEYGDLPLILRDSWPGVLHRPGTTSPHADVPHMADFEETLERMEAAAQMRTEAHMAQADRIDEATDALFNRHHDETLAVETRMARALERIAAALERP